MELKNVGILINSPFDTVTQIGEETFDPAMQACELMIADNAYFEFSDPETGQVYLCTSIDINIENITGFFINSSTTEIYTSVSVDFVGGRPGDRK